jgi:hypothetical protein
VPAGLPAGHPLASIIPTTNAAVAAWAAHSGQKASWLQLPWLTVECYLYVRLATIIASQVIAARCSVTFVTQAVLPGPAQLAAAAACAAGATMASSVLSVGVGVELVNKCVTAKMPAGCSCRG